MVATVGNCILDNSPSWWSKFTHNKLSIDVESKKQNVVIHWQCAYLLYDLSRIPWSRSPKSNVGGRELKSSQEEANTCLLLHSLHAAESNYKSVIITANDTDVFMLCLWSGTVSRSHIPKVWNKEPNKILDISKLSCALRDGVCDALICTRTFKGCDSVSAFDKNLRPTRRPSLNLDVRGRYLQNCSESYRRSPAICTCILPIQPKWTLFVASCSVQPWSWIKSVTSLLRLFVHACSLRKLSNCHLEEMSAFVPSLKDYGSRTDVDKTSWLFSGCVAQRCQALFCSYSLLHVCAFMNLPHRWLEVHRYV